MPPNLSGIQHEAYRKTPFSDPTGTPKSVSIIDSDGAPRSAGRRCILSQHSRQHQRAGASQMPQKIESGEGRERWSAAYLRKGTVVERSAAR